MKDKMVMAISIVLLHMLPISDSFRKRAPLKVYKVTLFCIPGRPSKEMYLAYKTLPASSVLGDNCLGGTFMMEIAPP